MFLIGTDFFASPGALFCIPNRPEELTEVTISNGIFDRLRGDNEADSDYTTEFTDDWNEDTAFDAKFEGDLNAGNTDYTVATVDKIRIKRRDPGGNWITLFQIEINELEQRAEYEVWKSTRLQEQTEFTMITVPFLDVNQKIEFTSLRTGVKKQYITKSISGDLMSGIMSVSAIKFYPLYPFIIV